MRLTKLPLSIDRSILNTQVTFDDGVRAFTVFTTWLINGDGYSSFYETMIRTDSPKLDWLYFQKRTNARVDAVVHHCDAIAYLIALEQGVTDESFDTHTAPPEALAVLLDWVEEHSGEVGRS